ncbi:metallophosphoesterase family protein [Sphingomonas faeni]|uniref:metallophosphoesterase family protein n=1 Tax=Sphingomonas faeni TaxID=185950 RepID=UPI0033652CE1
MRFAAQGPADRHAYIATRRFTPYAPRLYGIAVRYRPPHIVGIMISKLFKSRTASKTSTSVVPEGQRVYAVGDIHGCVELLDELIALIDADDAQRGPAETTLIFLGDIVDRGPASAAVIDRLIDLSKTRGTVRFLLGNHEEIFLGALDGEPKALRLFCRIGGRETILSYGMDATEYERLDYEELVHRLAELVPQEHRAFISAFEDMIVIGDYAFVHAGVRPDAPLDGQRSSDLRWIRDPFLEHRNKLEKTIVHGHTMTDEVEHRNHRIGVDTGAYASGKLTALGLEGGDVWHLQTNGSDRSNPALEHPAR